MLDATTTASLWAGVLAIGLYHGLNPAMGWPLAVAQGLSEQRATALFATWLPLGAGHLLAVALVLVPFALLDWLLHWSREIRAAAAALVLAFGLWQLLWPGRHPRWLARVRPTQLALWSFLMATAHGAALMLLPILIGLCEAPATMPAQDPGHAALRDLVQSGVGTAVAVALVHTAAMVGAGLGAAWVIYRYLGLRALRAAWLNLDRVWALGLVTAGTSALAMVLRG